MTDPRKNRKAELLAAARERLTSEQEARDAGRPSSNGSAKIRYRGQVMRGGSGGGAPGGGSNSVRYGSRNGAGSDDVRVALEKIKGLYRDGLISRADAEKKRSEILDRL